MFSLHFNSYKKRMFWGCFFVLCIKFVNLLFLVMIRSVKCWKPFQHSFNFWIIKRFVKFFSHLSFSNFQLFFLSWDFPKFSLSFLLISNEIYFIWSLIYSLSFLYGFMFPLFIIDFWNQSHAMVGWCFWSNCVNYSVLIHCHGL